MVKQFTPRCTPLSTWDLPQYHTDHFCGNIRLHKTLLEIPLWSYSSQTDHNPFQGHSTFHQTQAFCFVLWNKKPLFQSCKTQSGAESLCLRQHKFSLMCSVRGTSDPGPLITCSMTLLKSCPAGDMSFFVQWWFSLSLSCVHRKETATTPSTHPSQCFAAFWLEYEWLDITSDKNCVFAALKFFNQVVASTGWS